MLDLRERRLLKEIGHPDDRVHRGPNFVAHGSKKLALGFRCGQGMVPRLLQFHIPACEFRGCVGQCLLGGLALGDIGQRSCHTDRSALFVPHRLPSRTKPAVVTGLGAQPILDVVRRLVGKVGLQRCPDAALVVRVKTSGEVDEHIIDFVIFISEEFFASR